MSIARMPIFEPVPKYNGNSAKDSTSAPSIRLECAADIEPEPVRWLWNGWLAQGKLHILAGAPGTGKTTIALAFASALSCGGRWPDGTSAPVGDALIWSSEDSARDTLVPRLTANGANLNRVHFITAHIDTEGERPFDPATDMPALLAHFHTMPTKPKLLVIDSVVSAVSGDSHKNSETRRALQPLVDLAESVGCAVLGVSHFSKGTAGRDVVERVTGSLAFGALARIVLATAKRPADQGGGRLLVRAKSNLGPDTGGYRYDLQQTNLVDYPDISASCVLWGEAIKGSAREILAQAEIEPENDRGERNAVEEAATWLEGLLASGAIATKDIAAEAKAAGLTWKTVRNAKTSLGIKPRKVSMSDGWVWELPSKMPHDAEDAQHKEVGTFGDEGHLLEM